MATSVAFYRDVLGFQPLVVTPGAAFLAELGEGAHNRAKVVITGR